MDQDIIGRTLSGGMAFSPGFALKLKEWQPSDEGSLSIGFCSCQYRPDGHAVRVLDMAVHADILAGEGRDLKYKARLTHDQQESFVSVIRQFQSDLTFNESYRKQLEPILSRLGYAKVDDDRDGFPIYMDAKNLTVGFYAAPWMERFLVPLGRLADRVHPE